MRIDDLLRSVKSSFGEETYDLLRERLRPLYRTARYDVVQPVQNRLRFERRLRDVPAQQLDDRDVLFVVVDCLRNDHLSRAGYDRETTPFLDSLSGYSPNCVAAAPWTYSSVPSLLSGLYAHNHGAAYDQELRNQSVKNPPATVREDVYTLPELLAKDGYETYFDSAIVTAELPVRGRFERTAVHHDAPADELIDRFLDWWDSTGESRFGYLQLGDLHSPLHRPEESPFGEVEDVPNVERWDFTTTTEPREEFETYRRERIRLYDTVLRSVDAELRRLFEALSARGDLDDTLVVVTGDHGEEFWERVELERRHFHDPRGAYGTGHGHALVPEVLFVPLILAGGWEHNTDGVVSTTDVVPTVLAELGARDSVGEYDGVPLDRPPEDRVVLSEEIAYGYDQQAVVRGSHLLIDSPHESETVVLDLESDRQIDDPDVEAELRSFLTDDKRVGDPSHLDSRTEDQLADLGYL
ncbi:Arylsulfatase A [Halopelagius inordinatus]|uniref:Arylsulfatase A n=1 Tax=Halopelagius inordinatus TaxID=553467 RepID=A0A1I2U819_9EURY|nr:sulfatase-like hydrolase/transferase [Halopelagius inordinatus]SFG73260.1 Arylsulfatase A [Halopelagius inordinatus]